MIWRRLLHFLSFSKENLNNHKILKVFNSENYLYPTKIVFVLFLVETYFVNIFHVHFFFLPFEVFYTMDFNIRQIIFQNVEDFISSSTICHYIQKQQTDLKKKKRPGTTVVGTTSFFLRGLEPKLNLYLFSNRTRIT